jgi:5'-nucleotidase
LNILISNDDGVEAYGLKVLADEFKRWGDVKVVAPEKEQSTTGHSLTLHKPLRLKPLRPNVFAVNGGPADCIYLGVHEVMKKKPDLVISGINRGANLGQDVFYSGTVSAAREGCVMGIPAVAVSLSFDKEWMKAHASPNFIYDAHYKSAAKATRIVLEKMLKGLSGKKGSAGIKAGLKLWPKRVVLNINVPNVPFAKIAGYKVVHQGFRHYSAEIVKRKDARGKNYYWIGGMYKGFENIPDSDNVAVAANCVSITPLELDTTDRDAFMTLQKLFKQK